MLPKQWAQVQALVRELDPTQHTDPVCHKEDPRPRAAKINNFKNKNLKKQINKNKNLCICRGSGAV